MKTVKNRIIKICTWPNFPFIFLFIGMLIYHLALSLGFGDDAVAIHFLNNTDLGSYIIMRFNTWTSRTIIEIVGIKILNYQKLWILIDIIIMLIIALFISKIFTSKNQLKINWIVVCLVFVFPFITMSTAGWICTTINYNWVLAFGLLTIYPIKKILNNKKIKWYEYFIYIPALIYANDQEQMCAILFSVYLAFTVYILIKNKKIHSFMIIQLLLSFLNMIFILTCPGNAVRRVSEIAAWFPDWVNISLIRRLEMGFSSSLYEFIMKPNPVFMVFCGLLFICMLIKQKNNLYKVIALIPFLSNLIFGFFSNTLCGAFPSITIIINALGKYGTGIQLTSIRSLIPDLILVTVFISILISLYIIFEEKKEAILAIFIILLGFGSRMIMSFSPTIWASSSRTFIFMYFSFIICSVMLYNMILKTDNKKYINLCTSGIAVIACMSYINTLYYLP